MATSAHWRLILNGKSAGGDELRAAVAALRGTGLRLDVRVTWEAGDVERQVAEAIIDGVDTLVAAGGDGTLNGVAWALARRDEPADVLPALGLVPMGTANDFAVAARIPVGPGAALQLVRQSPPHPIDLLRIRAGDHEQWAVNLATGGFGTEVTTHTRESLKSMLGGLAYVVSGLGQLGRIEPQHARITGPGFEWEGEFIALGIGNGRQAGGGQVLCPDAWIDDGLLDLTVVPPLDGELAETLGTAMFDGRAAALERVATRVQLPWLDISAPRPLTLNLDGEPLQALAFRIDCVRGRLRMHLPADCPLRRKPATVGA
ncbi:lipid kinase YegS [Thermomonas sp.]|uniref:lipid kinase YegS n=1 Tax=Thermomonas sp. TaxID=1971895 RepID=UPI0024880F4D|nr:lipid kinase YegS [Thermomonas sp.]MDI1254159.1 lipid kinase YegS [Thermomonas sp.]